MKKLVLALAAVAAFGGTALAADLPARTYSKAPTMVEPTPSWTGFYIFGGVGGGVWDASNITLNAAGVGTVNQRQGGDGWFGTVGAGYDWQFNHSWVAGVFADGQFGSLRGSINDELSALTGTEKLRDSWAAGVRLGYLVAPNVYSYLNTGFTQSYWSSSSLGSVFGGAATVATPSFNRSGWFVGGGVENNLNIFGINAPGWFMKTEYRASYFNRATLAETFIANGALTGNSDTFKPFVQTISTSLVYRFNWGGPVVAKY
ncbi:MAG TPA: porin family protein [Bradyrhizobium sp.]|nr:porin family protein [Bradyrhizobium sp.]